MDDELINHQSEKTITPLGTIAECGTGEVRGSYLFRLFVSLRSSVKFPFWCCAEV